MVPKSLPLIALTLSAMLAFPNQAYAKKESIRSIADRVFAVSKQKYTQMDKSLSETTFARNYQRGALVTSDINWWCSGFYPGSLWYIYEYTKDDSIKDLAIKHTKKLSTLLSMNTDHDIGFQIGCSYGNMYRLTGDRECIGVLDKASQKLSERFSEKTGTIKSWDFLRKDWRYPVIIDNMMNLEMLFMTSKLTGKALYADVALRHATTTLNNHFREDFSSYHLVDYDPETGAVRSKETVQGYSDESAWARGQAWALYGFAMCYRETHDARFLNQAIGIADYLIDRLPEDGIPYWDFDSDKIPEDYKDASAAAIMASALADLSLVVKQAKIARQYRKISETIVRTLAGEDYLSKVGEDGDFILKHSVGNLPDNSEVDVPLTYADYYFLESLLRLISHRKIK